MSHPQQPDSISKSVLEWTKAWYDPNIREAEEFSINELDLCGFVSSFEYQTHNKLLRCCIVELESKGRTLVGYNIIGDAPAVCSNCEMYPVDCVCDNLEKADQKYQAQIME